MGWKCKDRLLFNFIIQWCLHFRTAEWSTKKKKHACHVESDGMRTGRRLSRGMRLLSASLLWRGVSLSSRLKGIAPRIRLSRSSSIGQTCLVPVSGPLLPLSLTVRHRWSTPFFYPHARPFVLCILIATRNVVGANNINKW